MSIALFPKDAGLASDLLFPILLIQCENRTLELLVGWSTDLDSPPFSTPLLLTTVLHRIDDEPIKELAWTISSTGMATFMPDKDIEGTIQKLFNANEFVVQATPRGILKTVVFEPTGLYWAVKPVLEACGQEID